MITLCDPDQVPELVHEQHVVPCPIRCTCNKVLPRERFRTLSRLSPSNSLRERLKLFALLGIVRPCCKKNLTTARETVIHSQVYPSNVTVIPGTTAKRQYRAN